MTLDARARRAARDFRGAVDEMDRSAPERRSPERFERYGRRRQRNQRIGSAVLAAIVSVAALALVARALGGPRNDRPADLPVPSGLIVFNETFIEGGESTESFTVRPDGSDLTRVGPAGTTVCGGNGDTWSPDGSTMMCQVFRPDLTTGTATVNADGSDYAVLSGPKLPVSFGCSAWSPDGTRLLCPYTSDVVYTVAPDGKGLQRLTSISADTGPSGYAADGSHAYFSVVDATGHRTLYSVKTDGTGEPTALSPPGVSVRDNYYFDGVSADSSPDGSEIVFAADVPDAQRALFVVSADGGRSRRITPAGIDPTSAQWSPSGSWIAFSVGDPESDLSSEVYLVHPNGAGLTAIASSTEGCSSYAPIWSPDGTTLLFQTQCSSGSTVISTSLEIVSVDGTNRSKVADLHGLTAYAWGA